MKIAVDFDGTIVEHKYPSIGKVRPFAFQTLKMLQEKGHLLVLWTYRSGRYLDEAVDFCRENGLEFYAVNSDYPGQEIDETISRKIDCECYIDDRNIGGLPSWGEIYHMLHPEEGGQIMEEPRKKKSFWKR
ncbi:MAG: HAD hydrolase family protein [Prolixibacteraceae bacterium]|nr:HAD hydrolase family protein [Prolixibacteraceae bacterium]